jgi:heme/copper-type cytochrome/quinol oxidase subunit 1
MLIVVSFPPSIPSEFIDIEPWRLASFIAKIGSTLVAIGGMFLIFWWTANGHGVRRFPIGLLGWCVILGLWALLMGILA